MTRSAILYNLNMIDLKLGQLIHDNEELPDCELTEKCVTILIFLKSPTNAGNC